MHIFDPTSFLGIHTDLSVIAIIAGIVVLIGLLQAERFGKWTALFLLTAVLTDVTGFFLPASKLLPSHIVGIISLVLLAVACFALYARNLSGAWRPIYVVTALVSLYLNVFVLVIQSFLKIPFLHALAPGNPPSAAIFAVVQGLVLLFFVVVIVGVWRRFRPMPVPA